MRYLVSVIDDTTGSATQTEMGVSKLQRAIDLAFASGCS
jgi:hypothetical protein